MSKRDDFQKTMEDNLALWGARLSTMKAKLSNETPEAGKAAVEEALAELQIQSDAATARLDTLKTTRGDQWDVLKLEMAKAWHDLDASMGVAEQAVRTHDDEARTTPPSPAAEATVESPTP